MTAVSAVLLPVMASAAPWEMKPGVQLPDDGVTSQKVELVDIDADGWVDILFANSKGEGVSGGPGNAEINQLLRNDGGTGFTEVGTVFEEADNSWVIKVGDVDNDGDADLVVGDNYSGSLSYVLLNEGNNTFTREDIVGSANASIGDLELGDVDGDGNLDILASDWGPLPHGQIDDPGGPVRLWLGNGDGTFTNGDAKLMMGMDVVAAWSFDLELVDINNDFALDVMISTRGDADPALVLLNDGDGNFTKHSVPVLQPMNTKNINVAFTPMDFDGDDFIDVVTLQDGGLSMCVGDPPVCARRNSLLLNDQNAGFTLPANYWAPQFNPGKIDFDAATLDFNNDARPDFVIIGQSINSQANARLLTNDGATFKYPSMPLDVAFPVDPQLEHSTGLMFADFDHDGREDVAVAQRDPGLKNFVLFGGTDPANGVPADTTAPRIYDLTNFGDKLGTLLFFGEDAGIEARVNDYKTPSHWHDYLYDTNLDSYNLTGDGAAATAHKRRLPYMEFALSLANPDDILAMPDTDPNKYISPSIWFGEALWRVGFTVPYNGMKEDTLTWQYCAIDAANNKTCVGPFSVKLEVNPADCGDGTVQEWETCDDDSVNCVMCENTCGNGMCDANETPESCPEDCGGECDNDGACEPPEDAENCPNDCNYDGFCGDMECQEPNENAQNCPQDCDPCDNDGACEPPEDSENCPNDCDYDGFCGDMECQEPHENESNCPQDCGGVTDGGMCGNGVCDANETVATCPEDCEPICGDGICTEPDENAMTCPEDCGESMSNSDGDCPDTAGGVDGQCQLDDDGCGCDTEPGDTRGLWASLLLFGVFGVRRFRRRA